MTGLWLFAMCLNVLVEDCPSGQPPTLVLMSYDQCVEVVVRRKRGMCISTSAEVVQDYRAIVERRKLLR